MPPEHLDIGPSENNQVVENIVSNDISIFRLATSEFGIIEEAPSSIFHLRFTLCCGTRRTNTKSLVI
jgi:hypothetical protein